jgi:hypothetical protein
MLHLREHFMSNELLTRAPHFVQRRQRCAIQNALLEESNEMLVSYQRFQQLRAAVLLLRLILSVLLLLVVRTLKVGKCLELRFTAGDALVQGGREFRRLYDLLHPHGDVRFADLLLRLELRNACFNLQELLLDIRRRRIQRGSRRCC